MTIQPGVYRKKIDTAHTYQHEFTCQAPLSRSTVGLTQPVASTYKQESLNKYHLLNNV